MPFYQCALQKEAGRTRSTLGWTIAWGLPEKTAPPSSVIPNINSGSLRLYKRLIFFLSTPPNNPPTMPFCAELFNFLLISHPVSKSMSHQPSFATILLPSSRYFPDCLWHIYDRLFDLSHEDKKGKIKSWKCISSTQTKCGPSCSWAIQISWLYPLAYV